MVAVGAAHAEDIKLGILFGFTGPLESITPPMARSAEMAIKEVSDSGALLDGSTVTPVRADSTCGDAAAATAAAQRLVTADHVNAIIGADCSGASAAVLQAVARPNGIVMVSPSATSPALSTAPDDGLFFRTAPSDARQGVVMADVLMKAGLKSVAVSYSNSDYGKGLDEAFEPAFKAAGGTITISAPHEDGKADYSADVGALASAGGDALVVIGYVDQGGKGIIQAATDSGAFSKFILSDGMYGNSLIKAIGAPLEGSIGIIPGAEGEGHTKFLTMAKAAGVDGTSSYTGESYDAAALIMLAMEAAKSSKSADFKGKIMQVANGPGEKILPGELAKGLKLLSEGKPIDYEGATAVKLIGPGEASGSYRIYTIKGGTQVTDYYE
ncbi:ABC transporter substrate-binding protein [Jiella sp. CQZ9-1]|uniref:ABC transporter substrate-binding protein n=2 Tax=Jiella flava TaxID=2816857 RepID=A0A939FXC6_9HYPH|nr:ABC transporter substrate-binding protein [Jiella flava]